MTLQLRGITYEAYESKVQVETEAGDWKVQVGEEESKVQVATGAID